jgi:hypothetical protein
MCNMLIKDTLIKDTLIKDTLIKDTLIKDTLQAWLNAMCNMFGTCTERLVRKLDKVAESGQVSPSNKP